MQMSYRKELIEKLAEHLMVLSGFEDKEKYPTEWDLSRDDTQLSMNMELSEYAVDYVLNNIMSATEEVELEPELEESDSAITTRLYVTMHSKDGEVRIADVREWLAKVDSLKVPDDAPIQGTLQLVIDFDGPAETIECGECGQDDIILGTHKHD